MLVSSFAGRGWICIGDEEKVFNVCSTRSTMRMETCSPSHSHKVEIYTTGMNSWNLLCERLYSTRLEVSWYLPLWIFNKPQ